MRRKRYRNLQLLDEVQVRVVVRDGREVPEPGSPEGEEVTHAERKKAATREEIIAAIDRGELLRVLADADAGRLTAADVVDALAERDRFWRRVRRLILGRS